MDGSFIIGSYFPKLLGLFWVFLISEGVLVVGCPFRCTCSQLLVNCTDRGLQRFPANISLNTKQLVLSDNNVSQLPTFKLKYLGNLLHLDLRNNSISEISESSLLGMKMLVYLDLSYNKLRSISHSVFQPLTNLLVLKINNNDGLTLIDSSAFIKNIKLGEIDISGNALTLVNVRAFRTLAHLKSLHMAGNHWICNCNINDLSNWMGNNREIIPDAANVICKYPKRMHGVRVLEVADKLPLCCLQFNCSHLFYWFLVGPAVFTASIIFNLILSLVMSFFRRYKKRDLENYHKLRKVISIRYSKRPIEIVHEINRKLSFNGKLVR
ncbi:leucine-rich repeat-containing protein 52 [Callorhinchus milii]|uniref:Leucine-rich repeat-containing protein 52-like n=1 Tax=Callorhinchus milii TaxID=7868 RepID=V9KQJ4_CALMI|nr:leucine-rich repeat-containing protein 52 [Callorhinchus milii]XP_007893835.1 leucine-rich repeat-containing protein 52 [Callorhinchus milii]|eukprot:gi/632956188/ref/XP_007893834.1/ PREDICTED: leucine-rich repeat-containing protein 52-like [Callorhinchus milii]